MLPFRRQVERAGMLAPGAQIGVLGVVAGLGEARRRDAAVIVGVVLGRADIGLVRQHQADGRGEGLAGALALEIGEGRGQHVAVLGLVGGLARPGPLDADAEGLVGALEHAQRMGVAARPVGAVIADQAVGIAVQLVRADRMQPADQGRPVAGGTQAVRVGRDVGGQDVGVGPAADPVAVLGGQHRHARRACRVAAVV